MKHYIFFCLLTITLLVPNISRAQTDTIPNGDFERWTVFGTKAVPQGWDTISGISYPVTSVNYFKSGVPLNRPVYDGKYAISLTNEAHGNKIANGMIYTKFPLKGKPQFFNFNMAYFQGVAQESPVFYLYFWTYNTMKHKRDSVPVLYQGLALTSPGSFEPWLLSSISLANFYSTINTAQPDSGLIEIHCTNAPGGQMSPNTILFLEKIWFSATQPTGISSEFEIQKGEVTVCPNPFNTTTTIHYNLIENSAVNLSVYDIQGRLVTTLVNEGELTGTHEATFKSEGLKNGLYIYRLQAGNSVNTGKIFLNK